MDVLVVLGLFFIFATVLSFLLALWLLYKALTVTRSITEEQRLMAQMFFPNVKIPQTKDGEPVTMGHVDPGPVWNDDAEGTG